jgi:hypothetical protein
MTTKPKAIVLAALVASQFDRLVAELHEAERTAASQPTKAEYERRMKQARRFTVPAACRLSPFRACTTS